MKFFWDAENGRYVDERGRVVSPDALRRMQAESESNHVVELTAIILAFLLWRQLNAVMTDEERMSAEEIFALAPEEIRARVRARVRTLGPVTSREYQVRMADQIEKSHRVNTVLAAGGFAAMTIGLWNYAAARARSERAFAARLAVEIERGTASPAQAVARTAQYAKAPYTTFSGSEARRERARGVIEARRILDETPGLEHCADCPELASEEWAPIEQVRPIGETVCGPNCRCFIEYRRETAAQAESVAA